MLTAQRHDLIQKSLQDAGQVSASEMAQRLGLSADTIRRDLRTLAEKGLCRRVYGGAVAPGAGPLDTRHERATAEKAQLAARAVGLIRPGRTILIDAGSTNAAIARAIPEGLGLTVITNALDIASALGRRGDIRLILLGGSFDPHSGACTGPDTLSAMNGLGADLLFLGACALDPVAGLTAFDPVQAQLKSAMIGASRKTAIAVTADKLGLRAPYRVAPCDRLNWLIADAPMGYANLVVL